VCGAKKPNYHKMTIEILEINKKTKDSKHDLVMKRTKFGSMNPKSGIY
jgi:hypothetical protein